MALRYLAVLFVGVHLLMVISYVNRRGGPEIIHFVQKANAPQPTPSPNTQTSSAEPIRFRYKVHILAEREVSVRPPIPPTPCLDHICFFCTVNILLKDGQFDLLRNKARRRVTSLTEL